MGLTPVYVCIHVPEFPAQTMLRLRPELKGQAVAVLDGHPPLEEVCSLNPEARRRGMAYGMTRAELDGFPGACLLRRSQAEERSARAVLMEGLSVFSPRMEVQAARGPAVDVVLDLTGTGRIFGSPDKAAAKIAHALRSLRFSVRLAVSANLKTAVCLAATARKPIVVAPGREGEALHDLPLAALPLTPEQAERLELWGLRTLGELAALPEKELVVRLGQEGKQLRSMARGEHSHLMVPEEPALALSEYMAFDAPVELLHSLLFVLSPMLDQLLARAQNHALGLASLTVTLGLNGGGEHVRTLKPALPVATREVLLKLLHLDLQAHPPSAGIMSVRLQAEPGDRSKVQLGLFAPQTPEPMRLDVTLARIAALVGEERVGRARLLDTHALQNFVLERFTVAEPAKPQPSAAALAGHLALRRCRPPVRLPVRLQDARPAAFTLAGKRYAVQRAFGPWRRSGQWWAPSVWSVEEWDVSASAADGDTLLCILGHDLLGQQWQIEALYD